MKGTNILSTEIMRINTFMLFKHDNEYEYKKSLKKIIMLWFALCRLFCVDSL